MNIQEQLVSVIIPVYNPGKYFHKCLESIVNQTHNNLEIILVDDGSSDGSEKICDEYALKDSRIVCIHQKNSGVSIARNNGIEKAAGDFYSVVDSDDYFELDMYEYLLKIIDETGCDAVNFEHFVTYSDHEERHRLSDDDYGLMNQHDAQAQLAEKVPFASNKLFSKKLIKKDVRFPEKLFRGEDIYFGVKAFEYADSVYFDDRPLLHYVQSEESAVRGKFRESQTSILRMPDYYYPIYEKKYPDLLETFKLHMLGTIIYVYCEMWLDSEKHLEYERQFKEKYKEIYDSVDRTLLSKKDKIKMGMFRYAPESFCRLHKTIHRL